MIAQYTERIRVKVEREGVPGSTSFYDRTLVPGNNIFALTADPPALDLNISNGIAVTGHRKCPLGLEPYISRIGQLAAESNLHAVSGMAPTADTWFAQGALEKGGKVSAVLAEGIGKGISGLPVWRQDISRRVLASGGNILSYNFSDPRSLPRALLDRNAISLALSRITVLTWGNQLKDDERGPSGTMTTTWLATRVAHTDLQRQQELKINLPGQYRMRILVIDWTGIAENPDLNRRYIRAAQTGQFPYIQVLRATELNEDFPKALGFV